MPAELVKSTEISNAEAAAIDNAGTSANTSLNSGIESEVKRFEGNISAPKPGESGTETRPDDSPKESIKLNDFGKLLGETGDVLKKLEDQKKDKPDEVNKSLDESKEKTDIKTKEDNRQEPNNDGRPARDLTGFGDREAKWLQRMPYDAYEYFAKSIKTSREAETLFKKEKEELSTKLKEVSEGRIELPPSYYENPQAVVLSPEYQEAQEALSLSQQIETHWKEQLERVEKGEEWYDLISDPKTGKIFVDKTGKEPTATNKINIITYFQKVANQSQRFATNIDNIVNSFKTKHGTLISNIRKAEKDYMPFFEDTKADVYKYVENVTPELKKAGINENNPAFSLLAKSCALNLILRQMLDEKNAEGVKKNGVAEDARRAGPTSKSATGGSVGGNKMEVTMEMYKKMGI